jgi:site-specific recombinase XerD
MHCLKEPSGKYVGYTYPEPLGSYIAEYDRQFLARRVHRHTPRRHARAIWEFFSRLPGRHDPTKIYATDVEDFREIRLAQGYSWNTVRTELGYVGTFFNWLIREKGLEMTNPVIWLEPKVKLRPQAGETIQPSTPVKRELSDRRLVPYV